MHTCAANCCSKQEASLEQVHRCIEDCSKRVTAAQNFIQTELNNFQVYKRKLHHNHQSEQTIEP